MKPKQIIALAKRFDWKLREEQPQLPDDVLNRINEYLIKLSKLNDENELTGEQVIELNNGFWAAELYIARTEGYIKGLEEGSKNIKKGQKCQKQ